MSDFQDLLDQFNAVEDDIVVCQRMIDSSRAQSADPEFIRVIDIQQAALDAKKARLREAKETAGRFIKIG